MLPFSKRKKPEEIELGDDDIVVLEEAAIEIDVADLEDLEPRRALPKVTAPPPKVSLRRLVNGPRIDKFEDDVADECLKSIAAATGSVRRPSLSDSFPASIVPPAPRLPQFDLSDADETTRRPAISSSSSFPVARDSVPGVLTPSSVPAAIASTPFARTSSAALPPASSIAPVSMNSSTSASTPEPTVILVRQPPKTGWVVAAAFLGAACALIGMHFMAKPAEPPPAPATIVVTSPPPPPAATTNNAPAPAAPASAAPVATVKFNDDQAVAVVAPAIVQAGPKPTVTVASVKPATPAPAKSAQNAQNAKPASLGPKLPDGSMALGARAPEPTKAAEKKAEPEPAPAPASNASKRKLTPEQELAEAQLRASMK